MTQDVAILWQQLHDGLRAFIAKRVADEADMDDILQETFLRMHRRLDGLKDPNKVVSWVYQITRHAIIDHYRKRVRTHELTVGLSGELDAVLPSRIHNPSSEGSGRLREELAGCLRPMIERLSSQYREAITLVELNGLTQQAAAKQLGLSVSGMKSRVQRGRKQLEQMLDACCVIERDRRQGIADYVTRDASCDPCRSSGTCSTS